MDQVRNTGPQEKIPNLDIATLALVLRREHQDSPVLDVGRFKELFATVIPDAVLSCSSLVVSISEFGRLDHSALDLNHGGIDLKTELFEIWVPGVLHLPYLLVSS